MIRDGVREQTHSQQYIYLHSKSVMHIPARHVAQKLMIPQRQQSHLPKIEPTFQRPYVDMQESAKMKRDFWKESRDHDPPSTVNKDNRYVTSTMI